MGEVYGLPRHVFDEERIERWAERRGALVKVDRGRGARHGERVSRGRRRRCRRACRTRGDDDAARVPAAARASIMPFTLVIDEQTAWGDEARVSKTSVCGSWGPIAGELRYFADKFGNPRASIEGTQIPVRRRCAQFATVDGRRARVRRGAAAGRRSSLRRRVEYHGFELEREIEPIDEFPPELADAGAARARRSAGAR